MDITLYDTEGRFVGHVSGHPQYVIAPTLEATPHQHVEGKQAENTYMTQGAVQVRQPCPAVLTGLKLTTVPNPCLLYINNVAYPCESNTIELEFDQPISYAIRIVAWPFLDGEFFIEN